MFNSPSRDIIYPSILSNLIRNGFGPVGALYELVCLENCA